MAYGDGFTLWVYRGRGPRSQTSHVDFFKSCAGHLRLHDWIIVPAVSRIYFVSSVEPGLQTWRVQT